MHASATRSGKANKLCDNAGREGDAGYMNDRVREERPFPEVLADFRRDPLSLLWAVPGIWLVDKPSGPSSNLAVVRARKAIGVKRIGHAGTLDPLASGLLLLMVGNATRLFDSLQDFSKTYVAGFRLGQRTDSRDITGERLDDWRPAAPVPRESGEIERCLARFRGEIMQIPPMHSALKKDGQPLYKLARRGMEVEREARAMRVDDLTLNSFDGTDGVLTLTASKGFYVRTLVDDVGLALGCGAVMTSLRRTRIGPYAVEAARGLDILAGSASAETAEEKTGCRNGRKSGDF